MSKPSVLRILYQSKVVTFILRSWVLALILGTVAYLLLHFQPTPYLIDELDSSSFVPDPDGFRRFYLDLNSDQRTEEFNMANTSDSASFILARWSTGAVRDQWNFKGRFVSSLMFPITSDHNHNGKTEISTVTLDQNRIFLNIIEPFGAVTVLVQDRLIDTIWTKYSRPNAHISAAKPADLNHDGSEEIIFSFHSGHARQPRRVYAYDIMTDSLWSSPYSGSILTEIQCHDLDRDGHLELTGRCDAPFNYTDDTVPHTDSISWLFILNEDLEYKVPPVSLGPPLSYTRQIQVPLNDTLVSIVIVTGQRDSVPLFDWYRLMPDLSLVREKFPFIDEFDGPYEFKKAANSYGCFFYNRIDKPIFVNPNGKVFVKKIFPNRVVPMDILNPHGGMPEFEYCLLVDGQTLMLAFYNADGRLLGSIRDVNYAALNSISWAHRVDGRPQLFLSGQDLMKWYEVKKNPWHYLQYLIWLSLIGGFYGFIVVIRLSQTHEIVRKERLRKELLELQLKSIKTQLDPHFTFNALSGLSYLAMSGDTIRVNNFINHFSKLLRSHLYSSDQALVKLSNEIDFLNHYMELQSMRFDDLIKLELNIDPEVDTDVLVPKMILQTHVENAVKHGLRPKLQGPREEIGLVMVTVNNQKEGLVILIEDNGVGRGNGQTPDEESTGRGLLVLDQIYSSVKQLYKMKIIQSFEDLKDADGKAAGTQVKIIINYR